ncbi:MAG: sensor histidine kinase [Chloroflexi bacterium]|nr:sensor histidine kinase [Chloroflexota bacterium]
MAITVALIAGVVALLAAGEVRGVDDLELRLRAERLAQAVARQGDLPVHQAAGRAGEDEDDDAEHREERGLERLEYRGVLAYAIAPDGSQWVALSEETADGLPDLLAAQSARAAGTGQFSALDTAEGQLRLYSLPVQRSGRVIAVVQVARSRYFAAETVSRLLLVVLGAGALGVLVSGAAGYWLAGRAMQPISAALQRQRDFVADASHELRTPLTLLRANAEYLLRHPDRPVAQHRGLVQDILDETDRLSRMVADLLTLARADSGQLEIVRAPVDLAALTTAVAREVQPLAVAKGLELRSEVAPQVVVQGDRDRLRQLVLILADNAIRYTDAGAVTLRVTGTRDHALISVADTGPGIAPERLPLIFERFYRADAARSAGDGGAGLGLPIARWIVEAHGGRLTVASTPGQGTTFTVRLPRPASAE